MAAKFNIDTSAWPLVKTRAEGDVDERSLEGFMLEIGALTARKQLYANVLDVSKLGAMTSELRARYAKFLKASFEEHKKYCVAVGMVSPSMIVRGVMTAISWLQPWPHPVKFCATWDEAEAFACDKLREAGLQPGGDQAKPAGGKTRKGA